MHVSIQNKKDHSTDQDDCLVHLFSARCVSHILVYIRILLAATEVSCWYFIVLAVYCFHGILRLFFLGSEEVITVLIGCLTLN